MYSYLWTMRSLFAVLAILGLAACTITLPDLVLPTPQPGTSPDTLTVTPVEVQPDELIDILGIYRWRFNLAVPPETEQISYQLQLHRAGQEPEMVTGISSWPVDTPYHEILIALYPVHGPIFQAEQLQYYIRSGGGSTTGLIENPALDFNALQPAQPAEPITDGVFALLTLGQDDTVGENTLTFALSISTGSLGTTQ